MTRHNLEIPKSVLVLKAAPLAALLLLICGLFAQTVLHPNAVVASVPTLTPATNQASAP
jgi:hypothetical protein